MHHNVLYTNDLYNVMFLLGFVCIAYHFSKLATYIVTEVYRRDKHCIDWCAISLSRVLYDNGKSYPIVLWVLLGAPVLAVLGAFSMPRIALASTNHRRP